jgi:hypothetical protein
MHCEISRCVARKVKALDAVSLTDINAEVDKTSHSDLANVPLSAYFVICNLDSYSAVVVIAIR